MVHRAPAVRHDGPADRGARVELPGPGQGAGASSTGPRSCIERRRAGAAGAAAAGQAGRAVGPARGAARRGRAGAVATSSCTAPTPSARRSTASTTCWRCGTGLDDADRRDFGFDPRVIDWTDYIRDIHLPSVVRARPREDHAGQEPHRAPHRAGCGRQVLSPERHLAAFDLENTLIASNVVESYSWLATRRLPADDRLRFIGRTLAEAPSAAVARPPGPGRLPALLLPPLRGRPGRPDRRRRRRAVQRAHPHQELPGRHPPGPRAPARSGTARC